VPNLLLKSALKYTQVLGWPVIPLEGKVPLTEHGALDATISLEIVNGWWKKWPHANIGLRTGLTFWVLDVDAKSGGVYSLEELEAKYGKLPDTIQQMTGADGRHYLWTPPGFAVHNSQGAIAPGLDVRGVNGYIVAAPSVHPESHKTYIWDGAANLENQKLLPAPPWLLERLQPKGNGPFKVPDRIQKGVQHGTLVGVAGKLRNLGFEPEEIFPSLMKINELRCQEPGPEKNIRKMAESMRRYEPGKFPINGNGENGVPEDMSQLQAPEIYSGNYKEPEMIIDDILYPGVTVLAGKSKLGKSWFALQLALAIASETPLAEYFHIRKPGRVLYLALEESKRQTHKRLHMLLPHATDFLDSLAFMYEMPPLLAGGAAALDAHLSEHPCEVLVIDTLLAAVRQAGRKNVDVMQADYNIMNTLHQLAAKHNIAIIVVAHTRKAPGDPLDTVQGTMGLVAAADAVWVMSRDVSGNTVLNVTGRDVYSNVFGLQRVRDGGWKVTGEGDEIAQGTERREIIELLRENGPMKLVSLGRILHKSVSNLHNMLSKLCEAGLVTRTHYGTYRLPNQEDKQ